MEEDSHCMLAKTFYLKRTDIDSYDEDGYGYIDFKIATLETVGNEEYFKVDKDILRIGFDLYFSKSCNISKKYFLTERKTSIFKIIDEIGHNEALFIGGKQENSISEKEYVKIINSLPNSYEHQCYDKARVCRALKNYFFVKQDKETMFNRYIESKEINSGDISEDEFGGFDIARYESLKNKLEAMLRNEMEYSEKSWQNEILKFIKIIFPKYVISVKKARILKGISKKDKHIDILLGDVNGNVDIIEIKKPSEIELLRKNPYRENYIPSLALQGAIMQAEKYIFYLMKNGDAAEKSLDEQYKNERTPDYHFKIINPKTLIIMGRTKGV